MVNGAKYQQIKKKSIKITISSPNNVNAKSVVKYLHTFKTHEGIFAASQFSSN